jgi:hypothetical protein
MLKEEVITVCDDPQGWNSPILLVGKKDRSTRFVVNYGPTLNKCISPQVDPYMLPRMDEVLTSLGEGQLYFTTVDLSSGYWQVKRKEKDRVKTAFQWKSKTYMFQRVPFGYTFSGAIFSRCVAKMLDSIQMRQNVSSYVDDVIQYGKNFDDYRKSLRQLLTAVVAFGVKLKNLNQKSAFVSTDRFGLNRAA